MCRVIAEARVDQDATWGAILAGNRMARLEHRAVIMTSTHRGRRLSWEVVHHPQPQRAPNARMAAALEV